MDPVILVKAVILGVVQGLTEFLPISSTGHLILAGEFLSFTGETAKLFDVFIQLGSILAVVWIYRERILSTLQSLPSSPPARRFWINIGIAFVPAAAVGFLAHGFIKRYLFGPVTVAGALVAGGIIILLIERFKREHRTHDMDGVSGRMALGVGLAQICALFPGVSRSGATIMGGLVTGMDRKTATEFSFFLAIPTMFMATLYDLAKSYRLLHSGDLAVLAVGFIAAFISALWVVRWLLRFVSGHTFTVFAWYRIIFGGILLGYFWLR